MNIFGIYEDFPERELRRAINVAMLIPFNYVEIQDTLSMAETETGRDITMPADPVFVRPGSLN